MQKPPYSAPDFTLRDQNGDEWSLAASRGRWVVLYFYPKDDTPGCTIEACSMRDARDTLGEMHAEVVGVSKDTADSHELFKAKHNLNFALLSDPNADVINAYGAWGMKQFGKEGILRKTFIINPEGTVVKVFGRVTPLGHGDQVIAELKRIQA
jgi:peroxiredoxin Q/BCP